MSFEKREGEVTLPFDPADTDGPSLAIIGKIRSPWEKGTAPRNLRRAREMACDAWVELDAAYVRGLTGLEVGAPVVLLYWMDRARRDLILQRPGHVDGPRGTFSLRSPARPNPIAMAIVTITSIDDETGRIGIDAIDCFDGTPLLDIKPWLSGVDIPPGAELDTA